MRHAALPQLVLLLRYPLRHAALPQLVLLLRYPMRHAALPQLLLLLSLTVCITASICVKASRFFPCMGSTSRAHQLLILNVHAFRQTSPSASLGMAGLLECWICLAL
jgi:hypothetical protein